MDLEEYIEFQKNQSTQPYFSQYIAMPVCFLNSQPNGEYSNLLIVAAFSNKPFSGKISSPVKRSYLSRLPDDKAAIVAIAFVCFARSCDHSFSFSH